MKQWMRLSLFLLALLLAGPVFAQNLQDAQKLQDVQKLQDAEYSVHLRRNLGYGNGNDVRGSFSLTVLGNLDSVAAVTYLMDGQEMVTLNEAPYQFNFSTGSYPNGTHALAARVKTKDGRQVTTPAISVNFISAQQESQSMQRILIPLLGGIFAIMLVVAGAQFLMTRGRGPAAPGAARSYGLKGGTICPRCGRAYAIHFMSVNLPGGYVDRCDYCGKWAFVRARSRAELDAAVQAELVSESAVPAVDGAQSEEERLKKMLDESKYQE